MGLTGVKLVTKVSIEFMNTVSTESRLFSVKILLVKFYIVFQRFIQKKLKYITTKH